MRKIYRTTDIQQKESQELTKKLYRTITDQAKQLDDARSCVRNISDLFTPVLLSQRRKFCDYCERLIFCDPLLYGRRGEELLWRKGFYEVISTAKKMKKEFSDLERCSIQAHIYAGIGFYHHLLSKLHLQFDIHLKQTIDFEIIIDNIEMPHVTQELEKWAEQCLHQCLIYLGDLSRYKLEWDTRSDPSITYRYYLQAVCFKPDYGMPHNQMGTLAMNQNRNLEAVYHYLRCLACEHSFEGTLNNLQSVLEKNSKFIEELPNMKESSDAIDDPRKSEIVKTFIARFLLLTDIWYFDKKVHNVYSLCHQTYKNLEDCLSQNQPNASDTSESNCSDNDSVTSESEYLSSHCIFRVVLICLLTISKLQTTNSPALSTLIAFTLSIYSQLIQNMCTHIEEAVLNFPLSDEKKKSSGILETVMTGKKRKSKPRRRKAFKIESDEDTDLSDNSHECDLSSSDDSFISDTDHILADSSDEEIDIKISDESTSERTKFNGSRTRDKKRIGDPQTKNYIFKKIQKMDPNVMLEIINEPGLMQSIKVIHDWLKLDPEIIKSCAMNTKTLIRQIIQLINLMNVNFSNAKGLNAKMKIADIITMENKIPTVEDITLKGVDIFRVAHADIDWDFVLNKNLNHKEESIIRIIKVVCFGKFLSKISETGVHYSLEENFLDCKLEEENMEKDGISAQTLMDDLEKQELNSTPSKSSVTSNSENKDNSGQINKMKHMGQLWLAAEVRALETRVKGTKATLSPYLVLDADVLIQHTNIVKQLVHSRRFILIVPSIVVSALDDLKKEKIEARDAIRWLESQFHKGNRFFRAQRSQESTPIPFVKYPKKKDRDMFVFIKIIECCHYFAVQQQGAANVVTFLIGKDIVNGENKDFSYAGLAKSAGIVLEPIISFYAKWKKNKGVR